MSCLPFCGKGSRVCKTPNDSSSNQTCLVSQPTQQSTSSFCRLVESKIGPKKGVSLFKLQDVLQTRNLVTHVFTARDEGAMLQIRMIEHYSFSFPISSFDYYKIAGMIPTVVVVLFQFTTVRCDGGFLPIHLFSITCFPGDDIKMFRLYSYSYCCSLH